jgi:hypothetical protein
MTTPPDSGASSVDSSPADKLRKDLGAEYYAILGVVTDYDQRLVIVKGWSVTLSLAALGLGFEKTHYALFGLAAFSAATFWAIDAMYKRFQLAYYSRMRDIEVAAYYLNRVSLEEFTQGMSSPRIDWYWSYRGHRGSDDPRIENPAAGPPHPHLFDWRHSQPWRRTAPELRRLYQWRRIMWQVALPHVVGVVLGLGLFIAALAGLPWLHELHPHP